MQCGSSLAGRGVGCCRFSNFQVSVSCNLLASEVVPTGLHSVVVSGSITWVSCVGVVGLWGLKGLLRLVGGYGV